MISIKDYLYFSSSKLTKLDKLSLSLTVLSHSLFYTTIIKKENNCWFSSEPTVVTKQMFILTQLIILF